MVAKRRKEEADRAAAKALARLAAVTSQGGENRVNAFRAADLRPPSPRAVMETLHARSLQSKSTAYRGDFNGVVEKHDKELEELAEWRLSCQKVAQREAREQAAS